MSAWYHAAPLGLSRTIDDEPPRPTTCDHGSAARSRARLSLGSRPRLLHDCTLHDPRSLRGRRCDCAPVAAGRSDAVLRGLAGDARIRAFLHHVRERLSPTADRALPCEARPRAPARRLSLSPPADDLGRRDHDHRDRDSLPGPTGRIRARGRRDLRRLYCARARARSGRILRHGRDDRENLSHRQGAAAGRARLRGGADLPLPQGQRTAAAHSCHRNGRDRRRRRFDRTR